MLINEMVIFYKVVSLRSFSQAAISLKTSKSFISKHITQLENDLKVRLLQRSTRQLSLTKEGEIFFAHCKNIFDEAQNAYNALADLSQQPSGVLKISVPPAFALHLLQQPLLLFCQAYPKVRIDIRLENAIEDIVKHGYDLAIRFSALADSNLVAKPIMPIYSHLYASPRYIAEHGMPKTPQYLTDHKLALYCDQQHVNELNFYRRDSLISVNINPYIISNSLDFIMKMIVTGSCIGILPDFMTKELLAQEKLMVCMPEYKLSHTKIYALYPYRKLVPLKVRVFIDFLISHVGANFCDV